MMALKNLSLIGAIFLSSVTLKAQQSPVITSWKLNTTGKKISNGTDSILVDVEAVYYDSNNVYIKTSGIPDYYTFKNNNGNHNAASDLKALFKIPRAPKQNTGSPLRTLGGGQYGLFKDGTLFFNGEDARSFKNQNIWHSLAYYFEGVDFDSSDGHSTPGNQYHHHVIDLSLVDLKQKSKHSPLIGFAFDGFPVYGPYGYSDSSDMSSKIVLMTPSYQKRNITDRTSLPDGTALNSSQYGPPIDSKNPLGAYREDYVFKAGSGILDIHNGRFTKTAEYPKGTYAYFGTIDSANIPVYPFVIGQSFYGVADNSNFGPNGGKGSLPSGTVKYSVMTGINSEMAPLLSFYPNPASGVLHINMPVQGIDYKIKVLDVSGRQVYATSFNSTTNEVDVSGLKAGFYLLHLNDTNSGNQWIAHLIKQ
jgi:hypothetical protein